MTKLHVLYTNKKKLLQETIFYCMAIVKKANVENKLQSKFFFFF